MIFLSDLSLPLGPCGVTTGGRGRGRGYTPNLLQADGLVVGAVALAVMSDPAAWVAHPSTRAVQIATLDTLLVCLFAADTANFGAILDKVGIESRALGLGLAIGGLAG